MLEQWQIPQLHSAISYFKMKAVKDFSAVILEFDEEKK